jgi:hypothetical protein
MRGVVSEPTSWRTLQEKVNEKSVESLGTLGRLPEDIEIYRAFRKKVKPQHLCIDYGPTHVL